MKIQPMSQCKCFLTGILFPALLAGALSARPAASSAQHHPRGSAITGIAHFAYYVSNLRRARAWYQDFLGFDLAFTVKTASGKARAAYFKINRHQFIILYPLRPGMKENHGWMHDAGFISDDIRQSHAFMARLGARGLSPIGQDPAGNRKFSFLDPSGFTIQVIQYSPHSRTAALAGKFDSPRRAGTWIDHIGLLQTSRRKAARFYGKFLDSPAGVIGHKLMIAHGPARFEIGWQRKKPAPIRFHIKDHICISVTHVPATVARLESLPIYRRFRPIEVHQLSNGKHVAELYDPDGNRVEFMEPPRRHALTAAARPTTQNSGYEVLTRLPPGHHALLERMTKALKLSYRQELLIEPRLHAEESVSQPLLRFSAFTPRQKHGVMLELKLAARRNLLPLLTPRQKTLMRHDIAILARTGREPLGHHHPRHAHQHHARHAHKRRKKTLPLLPLAQSEPQLCRAIRRYAAFKPAQKRALLLEVKRATLRRGARLPAAMRARLQGQIQRLRGGS